MDRETGRSRGFGFVTLASSDEASNAIQGMDGQVGIYICYLIFSSKSLRCSMSYSFDA